MLNEIPKNLYFIQYILIQTLPTKKKTKDMIHAQVVKKNEQKQ